MLGWNDSSADKTYSIEPFFTETKVWCSVECENEISVF